MVLTSAELNPQLQGKTWDGISANEGIPFPDTGIIQEWLPWLGKMHPLCSKIADCS